MSGRLDLLTRDVERAAAELTSLASSDPMANSALQVARLTAHTLRSFWLPALALDELPDGT